MAVILEGQNADNYGLDMPAITPTSVSTGWYTTPSSPATTFRHCPTHLHGSSTWKIGMREQGHQHVHATGTVASHPPALTMTLPLSASASPSTAH